MSTNPLLTYLNDHLAGSVAAIELLEHLRNISKGTDQERVFSALQSEIEEDQAVLQGIVHELGGKESPMRKAAGWLAAKVGEAKLKLDDPGSGELRLLEALESLGLGILGKLSLWRSLEVARQQFPELRKLDLAGLKARAVAQHDRVESERLQAAHAAFGS